MIGCERKQSIIALYFESENEFKPYNLEASSYSVLFWCVEENKGSRLPSQWSVVEDCPIWRVFEYSVQ